ncbi:hypothetical protein GCM10023177_19490 [Streptomyces violaceoruber]|nr:hypothetical protein JCM4020_77670 [Streptomyces coelicolor]
MPLGREPGNADSPRAVLPSDNAAVVDAVAVGAWEPGTPPRVRGTSRCRWRGSCRLPLLPATGGVPEGRVLGLLFVHKTLSPAP